MIIVSRGSHVSGPAAGGEKGSGPHSESRRLSRRRADPAKHRDARGPAVPGTAQASESVA